MISVTIMKVNPLVPYTTLQGRDESGDVSHRSCHSYLLSANSCGCTIGSGIGAPPGFHGVFAINIGETFELGGAAEYGALYGQVGGSKLDVVSQQVLCAITPGNQAQLPVTPF
jgi:hypothetical protein